MLPEPWSTLFHGNFLTHSSGASDPCIIAPEAFQKFLHQKLDELKLRDPAYSLRAFSKKLEMNSSAISEILNGKRRVSRTLALKMAQRLQLNPQEMADVQLILSSNAEDSTQTKSKEFRKSQQKYLEISRDQYHLVADWQYFAILSLAETIDFRPDPTWIAGRLGISIVQTKIALERLERLALLDRDFTSMTMAVDPRQLKSEKKMIREFRDHLCEVLEATPEKKEVYRMCIQMIPLTNGGKDESHE